MVDNISIENCFLSHCYHCKMLHDVQYIRVYLQVYLLNKWMTKTQSLQEVGREKKFKQKRKTQLLKYETLSRQSTCNKSQHHITRNARTEEKV